MSTVHTVPVVKSQVLPFGALAGVGEDGPFRAAFDEDRPKGAVVEYTARWVFHDKAEGVVELEVTFTAPFTGIVRARFDLKDDKTALQAAAQTGTVLVCPADSLDTMRPAVLIENVPPDLLPAIL